MLKVNFVTQNLAPFRMKWLEELGKYCEINIFHNGEYEKNINKKYITQQYKTLNTILIKKNIVGKKLFYYNYYPVMKSKCDILILDGYGFLSQQMLILFLKLMKKRYVISIDGGILKKESKIKYWIKKQLIAGADAYLSTSVYTDKYLAHYGALKEKIYRHLFSSVTFEDIIQEYCECKQELKKSLNIENKITIIAVGQFIERKGFDILIKSLRYVDSDIQVLFVGGNAQKYEELRKKYDYKTVHFVGFCEKEELKEYYLASDIFVLPTREDVWGLVIGEAFAMGLPVITTDKCIAGISMIKENENGFIIPVNDEKYLAEKIDLLAKDEKLRKKMANKNISLIKKYAINNAAAEDIKNLHKIYEKGKDENS